MVAGATKIRHKPGKFGLCTPVGAAAGVHAASTSSRSRIFAAPLPRPPTPKPAHKSSFTARWGRPEPLRQQGQATVRVHPSQRQPSCTRSAHAPFTMTSMRAPPAHKNERARVVGGRGATQTEVSDGAVALGRVCGRERAPRVSCSELLPVEAHCASAIVMRTDAAAPKQHCTRASGQISARGR
jgi:hypothetical protein